MVFSTYPLVALKVAVSPLVITSAQISVAATTMTEPLESLRKIWFGCCVRNKRSDQSFQKVATKLLLMGFKTFFFTSYILDLQFFGLSFESCIDDTSELSHFFLWKIHLRLPLAEVLIIWLGNLNMCHTWTLKRPVRSQWGLRQTLDHFLFELTLSYTTGSSSFWPQVTHLRCS